MTFHPRPMKTRLTVLLAVLVLLPGCILIRSTEHRISVNDDGTGEAVLRLIDLRSDEMADSLVAARLPDHDVVV